MANEWSLWSGMMHQVALEIFRTKETSRKAVLRCRHFKLNSLSRESSLRLCVLLPSFAKRGLTSNEVKVLSLS
jgi:hypothetical protein